MQMIRLQKHKKQGFHITFLNYNHPMFMKELINFNLFDLRFNIKASILLYPIKKERKESITPLTSFLMFFVKVPNLIVKLGSSSIKTSDKLWRWLIFSFSFRLMDMVTFKASFNN